MPLLDRRRVTHIIARVCETLVPLLAREMGYALSTTARNALDQITADIAQSTARTDATIMGKVE